MKQAADKLRGILTLKWEHFIGYNVVEACLDSAISSGYFACYPQIHPVVLYSDCYRMIMPDVRVPAGVLPPSHSSNGTTMPESTIATPD
ncbi:hypothetical protein CSKR_200657 [Clonorchis sinensis]|uniref:Uncharacterized protein n=1 Tax=Clonorchis sinensis TaxID=79923 RepID=A0A8T1MFA4_CLOSI|nr:hypothetical protein CSKR_200657 [Clonorchis sinensis]